MSRTSSDHLDDALLRRLALRPGEAPAAASDHLERCEECRAEVQVLRAVRAAAAGAGPPGACPDALVLARRADGLLRPDERAEVEPHVTACVPCSAVLDRLSRAQEAAGPLPVARRPAPSSLVEKLRALVSFEMPASVEIAVRGAQPAGASEGPFARGMQHYRAGRFTEAERELERAVEGGRGSAELWLYLGACRMHAKDALGAADAWRRATRAAPRAGELRWYLAQALLDDDRAEEALAELARASTLPGPHRDAAEALSRAVRAALG